MQQRHDLYATVHKGLRRELAIAIADLGTLDPHSDSAVADFVARFRGLVQLLFAHARHEDTHLGPHLARLAPQLYAEMEHEHVALDHELAGLDHAAAQPLDRRALHALYLRVTAWVGRYLLHIYREETAYMAVFHAAYTDAELGAIEGALIGSIEPVLLDRFMQVMVLAMNPADRHDLEAKLAA